MKKTWLLIVIAILAVALVGAACTTTEEPAANPDDQTQTDDQTAVDDSWSKVEARGELILGLDDSFPPMGFRDENNEIVGFDIDLANAVGEYLGITVTAKPIEWSTMTMSLNTGEIDVAWNGTSITPERLEAIDFTEPYMNSTPIIVALADSELATKEDLAGVTVGIQAESSALESVEKETEVVESFAELKQYSTYVEAMTDLEIGRLDAVIIDSVAFYGDFQPNNPDAYKVLEGEFTPEQYAVGIKKGANALADKLNEALQAVKDSGEATEISMKWFGEDLVI